MVKSSSNQRGFWQAQGLVELNLSRFQAAIEAGRTDRQRSAFFRLARYHGRTLRVLNSSLHSQDEPLAQAALHNFLALHRGMVRMHRSAPHNIPLPVALSEHSRDDFIRDLIMRVLAETPPALPFSAISQQVNHLNLLGQLSDVHIRQQLDALVQAGHIEHMESGFIRTSHPYIELDKDVAGLRALIGRTFFSSFALAGYDSLSTIDTQVQQFKLEFKHLMGLNDPHTIELFLNTVHMLLDTSVTATAVWHYTDLLHSPYPRPYQRAAFNAFRQGDYHSQIIEAPTGSGKTLIGMLCMQDWLRTLDVGQSILVLVPTNNYQQQWIDELCFNPIGLQIPPEIIFSGTPSEFNHYIQLTGLHPAILILTYSALSQLGSPTGKGGFDSQSVEIFLQQANVHHVMLDEVHKVVENPNSVTAQVTQLLISWQRDTSLRSLIGFSGTAVAYLNRFETLGLTLSYNVRMDDLVAAGFVAPFAELGVPFAYSLRERRIRELLNLYKDALRRYFNLLGPERLRQWFAAIPLEERMNIGHDVLGMYRGRSDWEEKISKRFRDWETGSTDSLKITETRLVILIQIANGWSDTELMQQSGADWEKFEEIVRELEAIKTELGTLVYLPKTITRLQRSGFSTELNAQQIRELPQTGVSATLRPEIAKDMLASTITGLYEGLSEWYLRTGEGRVATIKAIIEAEQKSRDISGTIIFDSGRHIPWRKGNSVPGYQGLAGLFSELLGDERFSIMAVLSNEMYLTWDASNPITQRIANFVRKELMEGEIAQAIFNMLISGLDIPKGTVTNISDLFFEHFITFTSSLGHMHAARPAAFDRAVFRPLRQMIKHAELGMGGKRLLARMDRRNVHLKGLLSNLFDYGLLAVHFSEAHVAEVEQVNGARQKFFVVTMPSGSRRKQLMYDLTSRIVDADSLDVNLVIVSNWARTGWNVIRPNLLIDATATRDVTAWQQLRGRAIRAWRTWHNDCYRLLSVLIGHHLLDGLELEQEDLSEDELLDDTLLSLLLKITTPEQQNRFQIGGISAFTHAERFQLALRLMKQYNKVTHIYELVKASGSTNQIIYDRKHKAWQRKKNIAEKHDKEVSVNPFSGVKSLGDNHAPLIYSQDPRHDVPDELQKQLLNSIAGCDDMIVSGWLEDSHGLS